jgi:hypothetical protein
MTGPVTQLQLGGVVHATATLNHHIWVLTCNRHCRQPLSSTVRGQLIEMTNTGRPLKRYPITDPGDITEGNGAIWIAHFYGGQVSRIDPRTGWPTATIPLQLPRPVARGDRRFLPAAISFSAGRVWVSSGRGWTAEINPHTGRLVGMVYSSSQATSATSAAGRTWIADELAGVGTYSTAGAHVERHQISWRGQSLSIETVASGGGLIWAWGWRELLTPGTPTVTVVTTINPRTDGIEHQWRVPNTAPMIIANGSAYVGDSRTGRLVRLTPPDHTQALHGPKAAGLTAVTAHALWVITRKGQLLRVALRRT